MDPISDPMQIEHPVLRDCAVQAALIDKTAEAVVELERLFAEPIDITAAESWPWQAEPLVMALAIMRAFLDTANRDLEELITTWLAEDPEHWGMFRLMLLDPWLPAPGRWRDGVPGWLALIPRWNAARSRMPFARRSPPGASSAPGSSILLASWGPCPLHWLTALEGRIGPVRA